MIGDGGFGLLDRDIFRFQANAGTTLSVSVNSQGILNTAFRLFDATGQELALISPSNSLNASLGNLVISTAGTYYVAVSDAANITYNPNAVGGGVPSATTGGYSLTITVAPGIGDTSRVLNTGGLQAGINNDGTFLASQLVGGTTQRVGIRYNNIEFLFSQSLATSQPQLFFGSPRAATRPATTGPVARDRPARLPHRRVRLRERMVASGLFRGLAVNRTLSFAEGDNFIAIDVTLHNTTSSRIEDLSWMEGSTRSRA